MQMGLTMQFNWIVMFSALTVAEKQKAGLR
jgi:hypothetical protein